MKRFILASLMLVFSTMAYAAHCPADAKAIDAGLAKVSLTDDQRVQIIQLRDKGLEQHAAGDHQGAVNTLSEAMRLLLNDME